MTQPNITVNVNPTTGTTAVKQTGEPGPEGPQGPAGPAGPAGADGADGADGAGVPLGGTTGQALVKNSNTDLDTVWQTIAGGFDPSSNQTITGSWDFNTFTDFAQGLEIAAGFDLRLGDWRMSRVTPNVATVAAGKKIQQNAAPTVGDDLVNKTYADSRGVEVQVLNTAGVSNWNKPENAQYVKIEIVAGGGGGGGGSCGAPGNNRPGGAAGAGGGPVVGTFLASELPATVPVTIGAGGTPGLGTTSGNGTNGGDGGDTFFGDLMRANGGAGGNGGSVGSTFSIPGSAGFAGTYDGSGAQIQGKNGGSGSINNGSNGSGAVQRGATGGGGGGGLNTSNVQTSGGNGGIRTAFSLQIPYTGTNGGAGGGPQTDGGVGNDTASKTWGSTGGGGGGSSSNNSVNAGNGGDGGSVGGGGGGGGAGTSGGAAKSGDGGAGQDGYAVITTFKGV